MFESKSNPPGRGPDLLETRIITTSKTRQNDLFLGPIARLKQKVFQLEQELVQAQHLACHDELTGLPTRSLLRDRLDQAIHQAARHHKQLGLLFLDLNSFKRINDTHGHHIGDALLIQVAKRLVSCIRAADSAYRLGGDEFVILLSEVDGERGAAKLMRKLYKHLAKPYSIGTHSFVITASIGNAIYPADGETRHELLRRADSAMYRAKSETKSAYEYPSMPGDNSLEQQPA